MQQHNEIKMMAALKSSVSREELDLIPAAIYQIKEQRLKEQQQLQQERDQQNRIYKKDSFINYGRGIYNCKTQTPKWVDLKTFVSNGVKPQKKYKFYD